MKTKSEMFQFSCEVECEDLGGGIKRQIMGYDEQAMSVKVDFEKGAIGSIHAHSNVQISYVISGKFEIIIGDERSILSTGDGFYIAPNCNHGAICLEEGSLLDFFSPCRVDFLK